MTEAERQLMREATACEWNAWFGKDAIGTCHLQGADENELLAIDGCQRSSQMGHTIVRHWISRSQPHQCPSRCTNVSCGRTPATSTLCFQRLACGLPVCAHGGTCGDVDVSGCGSLHTGLCSSDLTNSAASALERPQVQDQALWTELLHSLWFAKPLSEKSVAYSSKRN